MYTKLTWNNYEFVEQIKEDINPGQQISTLTLLLWTYYGYDIYFEYLKDKNIVLFYAQANEELKIIEQNKIATQFIGKFFIIFAYFDAKNMIEQHWFQLL